jgi:hypothetical protein
MKKNVSHIIAAIDRVSESIKSTCEDYTGQAWDCAADDEGEVEESPGEVYTYEFIDGPPVYVKGYRDPLTSVPRGARVVRVGDVYGRGDSSPHGAHSCTNRIGEVSASSPPPEGWRDVPPCKYPPGTMLRNNSRVFTITAARLGWVYDWSERDGPGGHSATESGFADCTVLLPDPYQVGSVHVIDCGPAGLWDVQITCRNGDKVAFINASINITEEYETTLNTFIQAVIPT